ncbi:MAG: CotH kinase family protein [Polyangiales bacterium]|nr:CotH kinase family protein [Myxococcales bacterium]
MGFIFRWFFVVATTLAATLAAAACGRPIDDPGDNDNVDKYPPTPPVSRFDSLPKRGDPGDCEDVEGFHAVRTLAQPRGTEVDIALHGTLDPELDYSACIDATGSAWRRSFEGSLSMLLIRPTKGVSTEALLDAVDAYLAKRPADEPVGALLWTSTVRSIDIPTTNRSRTRTRIASALAGAGTAGAANAVPPDAIRMTAASGGHAESTHRALVVLAPNGGGALDRPAQTGDPGAFVEQITGNATLVTAAEAAAEAVDTSIARGFYGVGVCTEEATTRITAGGDSLDVAIPELPWEFERGPGCDPDFTALGAFPFADRVELSFASAEDRATYDARLKANSKSEFAVQIRWHESLPPTRASANLRGQSSLKCARRNYSVNLRGDQGRPFFPHMASDEFYLISMCLDEAYINQTTADRVMQNAGLFPLDWKIVEVTVDGVTQGAYMMLEKNDDTLEDTIPVLDSVVRRRTDIDDKAPELEYARGSESAALAEYASIVDDLDGLEGEVLLDALDAKMDFEQFLRWIALMSVLENGDYIDEILFYATDSTDGAGATLFYSEMGWDPDDIFSACHHQGQFAIVDPHGLLYCAEGVLEHRVFDDPVVYARYVDTLETVLDEVNANSFGAALDQTLDELLPRFDDASIAAAMIELKKIDEAAGTPETSKAIITAAADRMRADFDARATLLRERIAAYRTGP